MSQTISDREKAAVLRIIEKAVQEAEGNQSAAARSLGISQQVLNAALMNGRIGRDMAEAVAKSKGTTLEQLAPAPRWTEETLPRGLVELRAKPPADLGPITDQDVDLAIAQFHMADGFNRWGARDWASWLRERRKEAARVGGHKIAAAQSIKHDPVAEEKARRASRRAAK